MTKTSIRHTINRRDLLGLFRSSHRRCSVKKRCFKKFGKFHRKTSVLESLFNNAGLQHYYLLLFVSPQNTKANSGSEFGLDETLTECKVFF